MEIGSLFRSSSAPESGQTCTQPILIADFGLVMVNFLQVLAKRSNPHVDFQRLLPVSLILARVRDVHGLARNQ